MSEMLKNTEQSYAMRGAYTIRKENVNPTDNQSLMLQAIVSTSFLAELTNCDFLNSEYFQAMKFENDSFKAILKQCGIGNHAVMHFALYTYLVLPKEILAREKYEKAVPLYNELDQYISTIVEKETYSTYKSEGERKKIKYCKHIRNAVAHAKSFLGEEKGVHYVTFVDDQEKNGIYSKCEIKLKTERVGEIILRLSNIVLVYFAEELN